MLGLWCCHNQTASTVSFKQKQTRPERMMMAEASNRFTCTRNPNPLCIHSKAHSRNPINIGKSQKRSLSCQEPGARIANCYPPEDTVPEPTNPQSTAFCEWRKANLNPGLSSWILWVTSQLRHLYRAFALAIPTQRSLPQISDMELPPVTYIIFSGYHIRRTLIQVVCP